MKKSRISLNWTDHRHAVMLIALWIFYRICNLLGVHHSNFTHEDISVELTPAVDKFADSRDKFAVYNYYHVDGRLFTVMITQVRAEGPIPEGPPDVIAHV